MDSLYGVGVLKSTDGGKTWMVLGGDLFRGKYISKVIAQGNCDTVWVAGSAGLYRSDDGGSSWSKVLSATPHTPGVTSLVADPRDPNTLYAAVSGQGVYQIDAQTNGIMRLTQGWTVTDPDRMFEIRLAHHAAGRW